MTIQKPQQALRVLVTGAKGFIGRNLLVSLGRRERMRVVGYDVESSPERLQEYLSEADVIYHLAGVNRPDSEDEFDRVNAGLTEEICSYLRTFQRSPVVVLSSSTQATTDNSYGMSKRKAEETVLEFGKYTGTPVFVYRLPGVFGKWCRPNYNSVVATFCHNITRDLPISVSDPSHEIELVYVDDVVRSFVNILNGQAPSKENEFCFVEPSYPIKLGQLADTIRGFRKNRSNLFLADMNERFTRCLYATYVSYLPKESLGYYLGRHIDLRGELAELLKSPHIGQIFVSRTRPGITRGNHYHDTKVEKFVVIEGEAVIRLRNIIDGDVSEYQVSGHEFCVIDIPPGYTHSIENVGQTDLIVLFWASEVLDQSFPDTYPMAVK